MQQRAGGRDVHAVGEAEEGGEGGQGLLEVVDPDVAAVDDARDQPLARQSAHGGEVVQVGGGGLGEVEGEAVHRGLGEDGERLAEPVEVGGDEELRPFGERTQVAVGAGGGVQLGRGAVLDQGGLVQLHPLGARRAQVGEDLGVHGEQPVEEGERCEVGGDAGGGLGQQEVGDGADEDGARGVAERAGLGQLGYLLRGVGGEDRVRAQLGHQVVVVGVEPLGHLQRRHVLVAAGHGEVAAEGVGLDGGAVPGGDGADHDTGVQDVVVVREVAGRHLVDAGFRQLPPVLPAQALGGLPEGVGADAALPVALDGLLQFAVRALAGVAVHGGPCCRGCGLRCHGNLLREKLLENPGDGTRTRRVTRRADLPARRTRGVPPALHADPPTRPPGFPYAIGRVRATGRSSDSRAHLPRQIPTGRRFPDPWPDPVRMTAVVPAHRCGAVPDSHRVPSCDAPAWRTGRTSCTGQRRGRARLWAPLFTSRNVMWDTGTGGRRGRGRWSRHAWHRSAPTRPHA